MFIASAYCHNGMLYVCVCVHLVYVYIYTVCNTPQLVEKLPNIFFLLLFF